MGFNASHNSSKEITLNGGHMFRIKKDQLFKVIKVMFPLLLLLLAIYEIQQTARGVDVEMLRTKWINCNHGSLD